MSRYRSEWNDLHGGGGGGGGVRRPGRMRRSDSLGAASRARDPRYHRGELSVFENSELGPMLNAEELDILERLVDLDPHLRNRVPPEQPLGFGADILTAEEREIRDRLRNLENQMSGGSSLGRSRFGPDYIMPPAPPGIYAYMPSLTA